MDLVSTVRYGKPCWQVERDNAGEHFLEQYEALGLVLHSDSKARSVGSAKMKIDIAATNPTAKK